MIDRFITVKQSPMLDEALNKLFDIPKGMILSFLDSMVIGNDEFIRTEYNNTTGWVLAINTDPYVNTNKNNIVYLDDIRTKDVSDPEQFVIWQNTAGNDIRCVNQCGEICCSEILGQSLSTTLARWRDNGSLYAYAFNGGKDKGTGTSQLQEILEIHGVESKLLDEYFNKVHTLYRYSEALKNNDIIFGVSINHFSGKLTVKKDVSHWVILRNIVVNGSNGLVTFYNPFNNEDQQASWNFLTLSAQAFSNGTFTGIVVKKLIDVVNENGR